MIDTKKLPRLAAGDTCFWIRALGQRPKDPRTPSAQEFLLQMAKSGGTMLMPAPALAELARGGRSVDMPRAGSIVVVSFDSQCAKLLGERFNQDVFKEQMTKSGFPKPFLQFDTMILATALRHKAECLITMDHEFLELDFGEVVPKGFRKQVQDFTLPLFQRVAEGEATGS